MNCQSIPRQVFDKTSSALVPENKSSVSEKFKDNIREFYNDANISDDSIFNYVYGILNSKEYQRKYESDLMKGMPKIPIVRNRDDFVKFSRAGKELGDLHIGMAYSPYVLRG